MSDQTAGVVVELNGEDVARLGRFARETRYVDRFADLLEEKRRLAARIKEAKDEAKARGFPVAALMAVAARKIETGDERAARVALERESYRILRGLGMWEDTPLGEATARAAEEAARQHG